MKLQQGGAESDENGAEDERAKDAEEKDAMLVLLRDAEEAEHNDEDEHVVDTERFFKHVAGEEFEGHLRAAAESKPTAIRRGSSGKCQSQ